MKPVALTRRHALGLAALSLASLAVAPARAGEPVTYAFSPVNQYGINLTAAYWNPIIAYVHEKSGIKLVLKLGRTSADTTAFVLAREIDIVFTNHLFSPEREQLGWKVFGRRQTPPLLGLIVVPADSPIKDVSELDGREVAYAGPEALVSYKYPAAYLLSKKIHTKPVFGGNTDGALAQLFSGKVPAAGVNSQLMEGYAQREGKKYRVLWTSAPTHDLALMSSAKVPAAHVKALAAAFTGMHKDPRGREILEHASQQVGLTAAAHFIASDGSEYNAYRDFYRTAPPQLR